MPVRGLAPPQKGRGNCAARMKALAEMSAAVIRSDLRASATTLHPAVFRPETAKELADVGAAGQLDVPPSP